MWCQRWFKFGVTVAHNSYRHRVVKKSRKNFFKHLYNMYNMLTESDNVLNICFRHKFFENQKNKKTKNSISLFRRLDASLSFARLFSPTFVLFFHLCFVCFSSVSFIWYISMSIQSTKQKYLHTYNAQTIKQKTVDVEQKNEHSQKPQKSKKIMLAFFFFIS